MRNYRDLMVWQKSMAFVTDIYKSTAAFPKSESLGLALQLRRCTVSIPSNIAEGYGRNSTADYVRFLKVAMGSLYEAQTQLEIALNLGYIINDDYDTLYETSREIERMLSSLISKIKQKQQA